METLLLIDGNAIMHRAYYAIPPTFKTKDGVPTNAVYGFLTMLCRAINDFNPEHIIICFDTPKPTFRKKLYEKYQAHRVKVSDEFKIQIPLIKEMLDKSKITQVEKEGYEADDLIGTLVAQNKKDLRILILTGDKDIMQLIDKNVYVITPQVGVSSIKLFDQNEVISKFGITPKKIPELKALMGDPSDNYPGAKGIGPKTATDLLLKFKTVENLLKNVDLIENKRIQTLISTHKDNILLSKQLATILTNVPIKINIHSTRFNGFNENLIEFLEKLEMKTLLGRLFQRKNEKKTTESKKDAVQDELFS